MLEILVVESRGIVVNFSFAVTAKLIFAFVFAYAKCWLPHDAAQVGFLYLLVCISELCFVYL